MKLKHVVASLSTIGIGFVLVKYFGDDLVFRKIPGRVVGYLSMATGVLGLLGVNVFYGGPLDKRKDKED